MTHSVLDPPPLRIEDIAHPLSCHPRLQGAQHGHERWQVAAALWNLVRLPAVHHRAALYALAESLSPADASFLDALCGAYRRAAFLSTGEEAPIGAF